MSKSLIPLKKSILSYQKNTRRIIFNRKDKYSPLQQSTSFGTHIAQRIVAVKSVLTLINKMPRDQLVTMETKGARFQNRCGNGSQYTSYQTEKRLKKGHSNHQLDAAHTLGVHLKFSMPGALSVTQILQESFTNALFATTNRHGPERVLDKAQQIFCLQAQKRQLLWQRPFREASVLSRQRTIMLNLLYLEQQKLKQRKLSGYRKQDTALYINIVKNINKLSLNNATYLKMR